MPARILVISDYRKYHPTRGEAEIFIQLAKQGYPVHIMTFKEGGHIDNFIAAGITITDFHPVKKMDKSEIRFIKKTVADWNADVVYLFNSRSILNGIQAVKNLDVKVILYRGLTGNVQWYDPTMYLKFYHPCVDKIVCNSIGVEEIFKKQGFIDPKKLVTINKGHRVEWYEGYKPHPIREELGLEADAFLVVNVAVNRKMKGIPYLLKAIALLPKDLPIYLILVGSNMDDKANTKIIHQHKIKDKVKIVGYRKDAINILASCDVKVLPSIKGESITKAVMEAMCLGVAPVISDIPGNKELVEHMKSGIVFPSKDSEAIKEAILKLYHDRDLKKMLGANAKERMEMVFNIDQTVEETKKLIDRI